MDTKLVNSLGSTGDENMFQFYIEVMLLPLPVAIEGFPEPPRSSDIHVVYLVLI